MRSILTIPTVFFAVTMSAATGYAQVRGAGESLELQKIRVDEPTPAQQGDLILKERAGDSDYCHMKFPAIDERTLGTRRPVLEPQSSGDIIDFYGPCNYDPDGRMAMHDQKEARFHWLSKSYDS